MLIKHQIKITKLAMSTPNADAKTFVYASAFSKNDKTGMIMDKLKHHISIIRR